MIIVVDTETTGTDPSAGARVIELAGVGVERFPPHAYLGRFSTLIAPEGPIPPETSAIHHLTADDFQGPLLSEATLESATEAMLASLTTHYPVGEGEIYFAAHNAEFDRSFFLPVYQDRPWLCTYRLALHLFPDSPAHSNQVLRYYLGLKPALPESLAPHRALYDAITTAELLRLMLLDKPAEELLALQARPVILRTIRFGKHRGELFSTLPKDYLKWVLRQDFDRDVKATAMYWLE